ncbi:MAG: hypothetical protein KI790_03230 [Cyclobacteriaceae bacterium]|nr:hypothetical protein [Cyclobacteriaceae bacterium HetDA_MAG_MS6]
MTVKATNYKNWCIENISPQAWSRILLKCLPQIRELGLKLGDFEDPSDDLELSAELMTDLNTALDELYQLKVEESLLVRY